MHAHKPYTLALVQMAPAETTRASVEKAADLVREAGKQGASLVCLPELFATPYFCQTEDHAHFALAEPIPGPTTQALALAAKDAKATVVIPLFERRASGLYHNSLAVAGPDGNLLGVYRKMHIPDDPLFYEKFYFTPGDLGFKRFDTPVGPIGTLICWDQWYPEAARLTALRGADILFYPTAIGWHPSEKAQYGTEQREAWMTIQRSHAIANGCYVASVNRVGHEIPPSGGDGLEFWGSSFVCGPMGTIIAEASTVLEEIILAEIDPQKVDTTRTHWPFLRDRRIDAYGDIVRRYIDEE
ncbi:N-carbamoyl-D-amino acid hydrolase [Fundidesulfovibrio magnetotacticus]|uniref:N-carbamoyl-D-amino acid hydrolase n=1 Tax=Fundidesulfovibrio magnetotacticus TaxID=2730080 RepID=A0A6V8LMY5_9BACT|nr:carbon-nitrogen hydrolase [Fundidesulfovibrio magnetotacticus]GFK94013.1 N-carbamoyl-D-amino acid hydrolase [Fundidesulfovibrio magnetotacticus]